MLLEEMFEESRLVGRQKYTSEPPTSQRGQTVFFYNSTVWRAELVRCGHELIMSSIAEAEPVWIITP